MNILLKSRCCCLWTCSNWYRLRYFFVWSMRLTLECRIDGGGSIRVPAASCDIVGLKTTCGRIPNEGTSVKGSNSVIGPMGATTADCHLLYSACSGDEVSCAPKSLSGVKIGVDFTWASQAHGDIFEQFCLTLNSLKEQGALIVEFRMPERMQKSNRILDLIA